MCEKEWEKIQQDAPRGYQDESVSATSSNESVGPGLLSKWKWVVLG